MIDHHVSKFFETLFWIGALLTFASFFYSRWFMITIIIGILLMTISAIREGFRLRRAKTMVGVIKKNEPKLIHRFILLIIVIAVFTYILLKQTIVYNLMMQFYDLTRSPATSTWWVFVLMGIIIGLIVLFIIIHMLRVKYGKLTTWLKLKFPKLKTMPHKKEEKPILKQGAVKKQNSFIKFWEKILTPIQKWSEQRKIRALKKQQENLQKELEHTRDKQLKEQQAKTEQSKKEKMVGKYAAVKIKPNFFKKLIWEEKGFWGRIIIWLSKKLEKRKAKKAEEEKVRLEHLRKKKIEELRKKVKEEKVLIKTEIKKHPILPRLLIVLFIFAITIIIILHKKGKFSIEDPLSAASLGLIIGLFLLYIVVNVYKVRKEKKTKEQKQEKGVLDKIKKEVVAKASKYETDVDKLYKLIEEVGCLTISEVAEGFGITKEQAEEWGKILESHGLIELNYPAIGELQLCKKKSKITE